MHERSTNRSHDSAINIIALYLFVIASTTTTLLHAYNIPFAKPRANLTYTLTERHWTLFRWYFERAPYVALTPLRSEDWDDLDTLNTELYTELSKDSILTFQMFNYIYCTHHVLSTQECSHEHTLTEPINEILNNIPRQWKESARHDEPVFGAVVYFSNLASLEISMAHLDVGEHPLTSSSGHYILMMNDVMPFTNCSRQTVARILQRMYDKHRIVQAIFVARIEGDATHQVGYYDPFYRWPTNARGIMKWALLENIELSLHSNWILNRGNDFDWHPFRIAIFRRYPTMLPTSEMSPPFRRSYYSNVAEYAANFSGFDGIVMGNLAKHLRFEVVPVLNANAKYGSKLPNQTITGVAGDIINDRADAAFNARFITDYGINDFDFLYPVYSDQYCIVAPAAEALPKYPQAMRCFTRNVWIGLLSIQFILALLWGVIRESGTQRHNNAYDDDDADGRKRHHLTLCDGLRAASRIIFVKQFSVYQMVLSHRIRLPKLSRERLFIATCLLTDVIIDAIFRSSQTLAFSSTVYRTEINTLKELHDSGLPVISTSGLVQNLFSNESETGPSFMRNLEERRQIRDDVVPIDLTAYARNVCAIERYSDVKILMQSVYLRSDGTSLLHIVPECPRSYHLGYVIKKGWPLKAKFMLMLGQFNESGLLKAWYDFVEHSLILSSYNQVHIAQNMVITYGDLLVFFRGLLVGLALATFVFFIEICVHRITHDFFEME